MPPLPPDTTPRGLIIYTSGGESHVMQFRYPLLTPKADVLANLNGVINTMFGAMHESDEVLGGLYIPEGSNISQVLAVTTGNGTWVSAGVGVDLTKVGFISRTGRSDDGRKVRATFFTQRTGELQETRYSLAVARSWASEWADGIDSQEPPAVTISGEEPIWASYINLGWNAHFQRAFR